MTARQCKQGHKLGLKKVTVSITDMDYNNSDILKQNFTRYFCGYLIKKCLSKHCCDLCGTYAKAHENLDDSLLMCYFRAYETATLDTFGKLQMPHDDFVYYISSMEVLFQNNFESMVVKDNVVENFKLLYSRLIYHHPCKDFPYEFLITLYTRVRLFYTLKYINRNFKTPNKDKKLIIWKHL